MQILLCPDSVSTMFQKLFRTLYIAVKEINPAYSHVDYTTEPPYSRYIAVKEIIIKGMYILATNT